MIPVVLSESGWDKITGIMAGLGMIAYVVMDFKRERDQENQSRELIERYARLDEKVGFLQQQVDALQGQGNKE